MMTINLAKGFYNAVRGHSVLKVDFNDYKFPSGRYRFDLEAHLAKLPPISEAYLDCIDGKYTPEKTIQALIDAYFPVRFFRVGHYEKMALVMGFIGMRGSGKSCSAVMVAVCDYLLRGLPVWSNIPIQVRVVYRDAEKIYESIPLSELDMLDLTLDYGGGCVLYDEVNMEAAESTRFSSSANLQFSYAIQQIRKRQLSLIWTCQGWNWLDNRLRWQTDFVMGCRDAALGKKRYRNSGIGDKCLWRVHDLSGTSGKFDWDYEIKHRYISDYLIAQEIVWLRPWWQAYSTDVLFGQDNYIQRYKITVREKQKAAMLQLDAPVKHAELAESSNTIVDLVDYCCATFDRLTCSHFWEWAGGNVDRTLQTEVGRLFRSRGFKRKGNSVSGRYWQRISKGG